MSVEVVPPPRTRVRRRCSISDRLIVVGIGTGMDRSLRTIKDLDVELVVVTDRITARVKDAADTVVHAPPDDIAAVRHGLDTAGVRTADGIMSLGYDNPPVVARLAARFGVPGVPPEVALDCHYKHRRIRRLAAAGLNTPRFAVAGDPADARRELHRIGLPAVVKPTDQTNSVGVCRLDSFVTAGELIDQACSLSRDGRIVLEEYLTGTEHTVAGMVIGGTVHITGLADREYSRKLEFAPYFFESGDTLPSRLAPHLAARVRATVAQGVAALGLDDTAFNCDVLVEGMGRVYLIELTCRITGARIATEVMPLATGAQLLPNAVRVSLGRPVEPGDFVLARDRAVVQRYLPATGGVVESVGDISATPRGDGVYDLFWGMDLYPGKLVPRFEKGLDNLAGVIVAAGSVAAAEQIAADTLARIPLTIR